MEEEIRVLDIHSKITDITDDERPVTRQDTEPVWQAVFEMSLFMLLNEGITIDVVIGTSVFGVFKETHNKDEFISVMKRPDRNGTHSKQKNINP